VRCEVDDEKLTWARGLTTQFLALAASPGEDDPPRPHFENEFLPTTTAAGSGTTRANRPPRHTAAIFSGGTRTASNNGPIPVAGALK
jgi:hypothetical protein